MKVEEGMAWNAAVVANGNKNARKDHSRENAKRPREPATSSAYDDLDEDVISGGELMTLGEEKKRRLTVEQVNFLEMSFNMDPKLEPERKALIAKRLGIRPRQVAIWFQNRRARWKNKQLEQDYESLKLKYDAVLKENQTLLKSNEAMAVENKQLQDEVLRLTALLQGSGKDGSLEAILVRTPTDSTFGFKEQQSSGGKSELTSPTSKLSDDHSETQDSGRSYPTSQEAEAEAAAVAMNEVSFGEYSSISMPCSGLKVELEYSPFLMPEELFGNVLNHPLLFQQLAANNVCLEDARSFHFGWEDQTAHGFPWSG